MLITIEAIISLDSLMRSRSIDNYISPQEIEQITEFIQQSTDRFEKYDGRIRMAQQRFNTDQLQKLYIAKYSRWEKAVKNKNPDTSSTYLDMIRSDNPSPCPIDQFLKTLMQIIEQAIPPNQLNNILQKLETDLTKCEFPCPCPSEP